MVSGIPEIIAHRGASREYPENTLAAFARALELGADALELDVHRTRDGVLVVHHDPQAQLANGEVVTLAAVRSLDLSAIPLPSGSHIPTLDQVFELVGERATVYVEVKARNVESLVAAAIARHPGATVAVHAFDHRIPVEVRALSPGLPIGLLSASYPLDVRSQLLPAAAEDWWQHADLIDEMLVRDVQAAGARLIAWTVNDPTLAGTLAAWGVDALCTDMPHEIRAALSAVPNRDSGR